MQYASVEEKNAFLSARQKNLELVFDDGTIIDNDDIALENMNLEQTLCDEKELRFGKVSAACFKTRISASTKRYKGLWFNAIIKIDGFERKLGRFKVNSDEMTSDHIYRDIVAYDCLYWAMNTDVTDWYNGLTFPITQKAFRDSLFTYLGIEQEEVVLPNDDIAFNKTVEAENFTGLTVLETMCEINAVWGVINSEGLFRYARMRTHEHDALYPSDDLYPSDNLYPNDIYDDNLSKGNYYQGTLKYEEYDVQPLSKVVIREDAEDLGYSYGSDGNTYVIQGNFLLYGAADEVLETVAKNFFSYASYISYTPSQLSCTGAPWREVGDLLKVVADKRTLTIPILSRRMSGITVLKDVYVAKGTETYGETKNTTSAQLKQLRGRTNKLTRSLEETKSEISKFETEVKDGYATKTELSSSIQQTSSSIKTEVSQTYETKSNASANYQNLSSSITQNANRITAEVSRATGAENNLSTRIEQTAESVSSKVSKGDVVSEINQSAEQITLKGNRVVVESDKWKVNADGSQECSDMTITGGSITLTGDSNETTKMIIKNSNGAYWDMCPGLIRYYDKDGNRLVNFFAALSLLSFVDSSGNTANVSPISISTSGSMSAQRLALGASGTYASQLYVNGDAQILNSLMVSGTKSRKSTTENYGERLLYCYETPSPMFGDIGEGKLDETGKCYIFIDDIFCETIDTDCTYQVFLQAYGKGECYVTERNSSYFIVEGTANLSFGWEIKAIQKNYDTMRLEEYEEQEIEGNTISETEAYLNSLINEVDAVEETETYLNSLVYEEDTVVETEEYLNSLVNEESEAET